MGPYSQVTEGSRPKVPPVAILNQIAPSITVTTKVTNQTDGMASFVAGIVVGLALMMAFGSDQVPKDKRHG